VEQITWVKEAPGETGVPVSLKAKLR